MCYVTPICVTNFAHREEYITHKQYLDWKIKYLICWNTRKRGFFCSLNLFHFRCSHNTNS